MRQRLPSGVNAFQERCESQLIAALADRGLRLDHRRLDEREEPSITADVSGAGITVWIHPDTVEAFAGESEIVRIEEWDRRTPDELLRDYVERVTTALSRSEGLQ